MLLCWRRASACASFLQVRQRWPRSLALPSLTPGSVSAAMVRLQGEQQGGLVLLLGARLPVALPQHCLFLSPRSRATAAGLQSEACAGCFEWQKQELRAELAAIGKPRARPPPTLFTRCGH